MEYSALIIDDDVWMQRILSKTLTGFGFKQTYLASNGFDGIALAVEHKPNLIILDIIMPDLTGHLALRILKTIKLTRDIPVVMVSALSDVENLGKAVKSGTAGFISKPFTRATVFDKLIDVFGKEKLEMISKGISIYSTEDFYTTQYDESLKNQTEEQKHSDNLSENIKEKPIEKAEEQKEQKDKLLKHYNDDEKRSIESIKKMLLKQK